MQLIVKQYIRPNGRTRMESIEIPDSYKDKVDLIKSLDCEVTAEELTTGEISQIIFCEDGDIDIEISDPGPDAKTALLALLDRFNQTVYNDFISEQEEKYADDDEYWEDAFDDEGEEDE